MRFEAKFFNMQLAFQGKASLLFAAVVLALGAAATAAGWGHVDTREDKARWRG